MFLENYNLVDAIKRVFKLKDKNNDLYLVLSMITDQFDTDPKKDQKKPNLSIAYYLKKIDIQNLKKKSIQVFTYLLIIIIMIIHIQE